MSKTNKKMPDAWAPDTDFYGRVLKFLCIGGLSAGLPFGIYHALWGNPWVLAVLLPIMSAQGLSLYLIYRNGFNPVSANLLAFVQVGAVAAYVYSVGFEASYWLYASAVANFYIVRWRAALIYNTGAAILVTTMMLSVPEYLSRFLFSYVLVNIFLYAYSRHLDRRTREVNTLLHTDALTGAGNRMAMEAAMERSLGHFRRYQTPTTLLMLDLDHYKRVNDEYGHSVGDRILKTFTATIASRLRETDHFCRFGGEEFVIIADNTSLSDARRLAEDLRDMVAHTAFPPTGGLTISVGLAELRDGETTDDWLRRADLALYEAKNAGRNQVQSAGRGAGDSSPGDVTPELA